MLAATALLQTGCERADDGDPPPDANAVSNAPPVTSVELTGDQLNSVKIAPVGTYRFPVEREAVGTVYFDEEPGTVQAESTLLGAAAAEEVASNVLARARKLVGPNGVSKAELEQDISTEETDAAALKAARDAVRALGEADDDIDQMIAAGRIEAEQGGQGRPKWVLASVAESDSPLLQPGQPVQVKVTAFPGRIFKGTVSKIYATIDPNTHRLSVRCQVGDPGDKLRVGMLATVVVQVSKPVDAIAIPVNGIVREGDGAMTAWVTADRRHFTQRIVKTGLREDGEVEVLAGLKKGELAVTDGAIFLDNMLQAPVDD